MNANKLFSEFSLKKIWDKLIQHDKAMNSTLLVLSSGNWEEQEVGTFKNTVSYSSFKETDKLTVDLYDDGNLSETALVEYEQYIDEFDIIDGALVATANTKPTQTMTIVVKGDFENSEATVSRELLESCFQSVSNGKNLIASAITDKKVPTDADATFAEMAANIESLKLGSGNAVIADVLEGKTFTNSDGIEYTGEMPNIAAIDNAIASNYVTNGSSGTGIYARMNSGAHIQKASSGYSELYIPQDQINTMFNATATAAKITKGFTAWVNGVKITGTRPAPSTMQSGSFGVSSASYETVTKTVYFSPAFDTKPEVTYTINAYRFSMQSVEVYNTHVIFKLLHSHGNDHHSGTVTWTATV